MTTRLTMLTAIAPDEARRTILNACEQAGGRLARAGILLDVAPMTLRACVRSLGLSEQVDEIFARSAKARRKNISKVAARPPPNLSEE